MNSLIKYKEYNGELHITLNDDGLAEIADIIERNNDYIGMWLDLTEYERCNGEFEYVVPEQIGALTSAPIIGFDVQWDENGNIIENEDTRYYWLANYAIIDETDLLRKGETIKLQKG